MSAAELLDWQVLEEVDPFGQARLDYHFAKLQALLAFGLGIRQKDGTEFKVTDFIPPFPIRPKGEIIEPVKEQSPKQIEALFTLWVKGHNKRLVELGNRRKGN